MKRQLILSVALILILTTIISAQEWTDLEVPETLPTTTIHFDEKEFYFGKIGQGEKIQYAFKFINLGNEPLILSNAKGSCGCVVPSWPKEPILPGNSGAIVVEFDSKNKIGMQTKQVTITANTNPPQSLLYIKGEIYKPSDGVDISIYKDIEENPQNEVVQNGASGINLPNPNPTDNSVEQILHEEEPVHPASTISFDEREFNFGKIREGEKVQHIFRFTNTGDGPLILSNAKGNCGCTVPSWPAEPILPGGSGAIVVEFDSKAKMGLQTKLVTITANTDPPQSILYIKGEIYTPSSDENSGFDKMLGESHIIKDVEKTSSNNISVYPNPTDGILWLNIQDAIGQAANIEVFNGGGQLIHKKEVTETGVDPIQLDVADYVSGAYWLSVKVGDSRRVSLPFVVGK